MIQHHGDNTVLGSANNLTTPSYPRCARLQPSPQRPPPTDVSEISHNDARAPRLLPLLGRLVWVSLDHLPDEVLEYVLHMPVLLGRGLVEGEAPSGGEFLDR